MKEKRSKSKAAVEEEQEAVPVAKKEKKAKKLEVETLPSTKKLQKQRKEELLEEIPSESQPKKKKIKVSEPETADNNSRQKQGKAEKSPNPSKGVAAEQDNKKAKKSEKNKAQIAEQENQQEPQKKKKAKNNSKGRIFEGKKKEKEERGVVYVGHLPYGFVEEGLRGYFEQYGEITHLRLARSKKTARSKGYAFVEFKFREVAEIAAKAMNGYMMSGKTIVCHVLQKDRANPFSFRFGSKKFRYIPWKKIYIKEKNKPHSPYVGLNLLNFEQEKNDGQLKKHVEKLIKKEEEKRKKLAELGIDYEFPGYKALLE